MEATLNELLQMNSSFVLVRFEGSCAESGCICGKVPASRIYAKELATLFSTLLPKMRNLSTTAIFGLEDFSPFWKRPQSRAQQVPIFVPARFESESHAVAVPTFNYRMAGAGTWASLGNRNHAWADRKPALIWRGATRGRLCRCELYGYLRHRLVNISRSAPDLVDAKSTSEGAKYMNMSDQARYKYTLYLPGQNDAYAWRLPELMANNYLIFMPTMSLHEAWFMPQLQAYKHFIPVRADLSDLLDKILWARGHDERAQLIAEHATAFQEMVLRPACASHALSQALQRIHPVHGLHWECRHPCAAFKQVGTCPDSTDSTLKASNANGAAFSHAAGDVAHMAVSSSAKLKPTRAFFWPLG